MTRVLFFFLFLGYNSFSQTIIRGVTTISTDNIYSDSVNSSPNKLFNDRIKIAQIDKSEAKIDIRLYTIHSMSNTRSLRRIYMVGTTWKAFEYYESNNPIKITKHKLNFESSIDSIVLQLFSSNILSLPNQSDLKSKMRKISVTEEGDTLYNHIAVLDGNSYIVEFKINNKFRVYSFDNPERYARFYDKVSELKDYQKINEIFKFLRRK